MVNAERGLAYPAHCGRYECAECAGIKRKAASLVIERGVRLYLGSGQRVRFLTLTRAPERGLDTLADLLAAWERFKSRLSYEAKLGAYWVTVETTVAGEVHLHALLVPPDTNGGFLDNRRTLTYKGRKRPKRGDIPPCLGSNGQLTAVSPLGVTAWESGFGYVAWIEEIRLDSEVITRVADYLSKPEEEVTDADTAGRPPFLGPLAVRAGGWSRWEGSSGFGRQLAGR